MKRLLFFATLLLLLPTLSFAKIGGNWEPVAPYVPPMEHSKQQVVIHEFFAFHCPHCYELSKHLPALKKKYGNKLKVISVPVAWLGEDPGRLMLIARQKGEEKEEEVKAMIFDFLHAKGMGEAMYQRNRLQYVARKTGLSKEFETLMDDPQISKEMKAGLDLAKTYQIRSTPTLIIEGSMRTYGDPDNLVKIIDSLLAP